MSNRFGVSDSLLDAVKGVQNQDVSKYAAFGYVTEKKKMDPVGDADSDIDNDGDVDKSDKYLHNRRKAIKKAMGGKKDEIELNPDDKTDSVKEDVSNKPVASVGGKPVRHVDYDSEQHHFKHGDSKTISVNDMGSHDHVISKVKAAGVHPDHQAQVAKAIHKTINMESYVPEMHNHTKKEKK